MTTTQRADKVGDTDDQADDAHRRSTPRARRRRQRDDRRPTTPMSHLPDAAATTRDALAEAGRTITASSDDRLSAGTLVSVGFALGLLGRRRQPPARPPGARAGRGDGPDAPRPPVRRAARRRAALTHQDEPLSDLQGGAIVRSARRGTGLRRGRPYGDRTRPRSRGRPPHRRLDTMDDVKKGYREAEDRPRRPGARPTVTRASPTRSGTPATRSARTSATPATTCATPPTRTRRTRATRPRADPSATSRAPAMTPGPDAVSGRQRPMALRDPHRLTPSAAWRYAPIDAPADRRGRARRDAPIARGRPPRRRRRRADRARRGA